MSNPYNLNAQQALILKALSEGLTLQYERRCKGTGDWVDSQNSIPELFMVAASTSSIVYRIKPKTVTIETQLYADAAASGQEFLYTWRSDTGTSRTSIESGGSFKRWLGYSQTVELEQAQ
jgi:hypothetical protein